MRNQLPNTLFIVIGLAVLFGGLFGIYNPTAQAASAPENPPDPQFETLVEFSAQDIQAGYAPIAQSADHSTAPTLQIPQAEPHGAQTLAGEPVDDPVQAIPEPPANLIPRRIIIEKIQLDAPVVIAGMRVVKGYEQEYTQWLAPDDFASGWHADSAFLGQTGNTVINGHHNVFGEVFKDLKDLQSGDLIRLESGRWTFTYAVANVMILPERDEKLRLRLDNAQWIERSEDERLTLVTCWPPESNTHRVIIVAVPHSVEYQN